MNYENIILEKNGAIAKITLHRPKVLNALSPKMVSEFTKAMQDLSNDDDIRVVVVTGTGRAWSAGVDLKSLNSGIVNGIFEDNQIIDLGNELIPAIEQSPKICIAMVNGYCFTGAMEFMMAFDLIITADEAKIGDTHAKWGILPKWGMSQRLAKLVGVLKARELSFTCEAVSGQEAARIGLANKSVPLDQLEQTTMEMAEKIIGNSAQGVAAFKHLYHFGHSNTLKEGLQYETDYMEPITDRGAFLKNFTKNK